MGAAEKVPHFLPHFLAEYRVSRSVKHWRCTLYSRQWTLSREYFCIVCVTFEACPCLDNCIHMLQAKKCALELQYCKSCSVFCL